MMMKDEEENMTMAPKREYGVQLRSLYITPTTFPMLPLVSMGLGHVPDNSRFVAFCLGAGRR